MNKQSVTLAMTIGKNWKKNKKKKKKKKHI